MQKIKNVKQLRGHLLAKLSSYSEDNAQEIRDITKLASAIVRSAKVEMDYKKIKGDSGKIDFLEEK